MNNKILKVGFRYLIVIIIITAIAVAIPNIAIEKELQVNDTQEEVPLQNAVGENKVETIQFAKAKTTKKKVVKKKKNTKKKKVVKKKVVKKKKKKKRIVKYTRKSLGLNVKAKTSDIIQYAHQMTLNFGWGEEGWQYIIKIVNHESGWSGNAVNPSSGACGIPQALPCRKMKSAGKDYKTNYKTQVKWLMNYIAGRYGYPAKAWAFWQKHHWY